MDLGCFLQWVDLFHCLAREINGIVHAAGTRIIAVSNMICCLQCGETVGPINSGRKFFQNQELRPESLRRTYLPKLPGWLENDQHNWLNIT